VLEAVMNRLKTQKGLSREWPAEPMLGGWYTEEEIEAVVKAIRSSMDPAVGFGFFCDEIVDFERQFADYIGCKYALSITSAGTGLDMAMRALDLQPGDEVIVPAINFRAAHYAVLGAGGKLVMCESDETLNADPADVEKKITPRTRAILVTHMNGLSAPICDYLEIAERHPHPKYGPPKVIGDAARALGGEYKGEKIGTKGWMTIFSLHTMKMMTTLGEGGMITTNDPELMARLRALRQWGIAQSDDLEIARGKKGTGNQGWGSNYKMTKIQAVVGMVQLRRLDEMIRPRIALAEKRTAILSQVPGLTVPVIPSDCKPVYYLYNLLVPEAWAGAKRDSFMKLLRTKYGVDTVVANPPVYQTDSFIRNNIGEQRCPRSEQIGARLVNIPLHPLMSEEDNEFICAAVIDCFNEIARS